MMFTDNNDENLEVVKELIRGMPAAAQQRARKTGERLVNLIDKMKKENPTDPAIALGVAFAVFYTADHFVKQEQQGHEKGIIQLLS